MSDFSVAPTMSKHVVSTLSLESRVMGGLVAPASTAWPTAKKVLYLPFELRAPFPVSKLWWLNGAAVSGNLDMGIYSGDGTLLLNVGSTAQSGTSTLQSAAPNVTPLLLPDSYYFALVFDNITSTVLRQADTLNAYANLKGMAMQTLANLPLPATVTFASINTSFIPICGMLSTSPGVI